jgi:hypothetical protein
MYHTVQGLIIITILILLTQYKRFLQKPIIAQLVNNFPAKVYS